MRFVGNYVRVKGFLGNKLRIDDKGWFYFWFRFYKNLKEF